jgi:3-phenylpropionate/trans-cinnamate dioxygenase ferredoxin reductase subunit
VNCANGIIVDEHRRTDISGIHAAGDCANHYSRLADGWIRLESVQHAQDQGKEVGLAIAGRESAYDSVPRFWSDQYDIRLQIVGLSGGCDRVVVRGPVDDAGFSVFHYRKDRLIAAESVNRSGDQMIARRLIAMGVAPTAEQAEDPAFDLKSLLKTAAKADAQDEAPR